MLDINLECVCSSNILDLLSARRRRTPVFLISVNGWKLRWSFPKFSKIIKTFFWRRSFLTPWRFFRTPTQPQYNAQDISVMDKCLLQSMVWMIDTCTVPFDSNSGSRKWVWKFATDFDHCSSRPLRTLWPEPTNQTHEPPYFGQSEKKLFPETGMTEKGFDLPVKSMRENTWKRRWIFILSRTVWYIILPFHHTDLNISYSIAY